MTALKAGAKTNPNSLAGAIAGLIREERRVEVQTIGAGALNQVIKAAAIARGYVAPTGYNLICLPSFEEIEIDGQERTAIKMLIEPR